MQIRFQVVYPVALLSVMMVAFAISGFGGYYVTKLVVADYLYVVGFIGFLFGTIGYIKLNNDSLFLATALWSLVTVGGVAGAVYLQPAFWTIPMVFGGAVATILFRYWIIYRLFRI